MSLLDQMKPVSGPDNDYWRPEIGDALEGTITARETINSARYGEAWLLTIVGTAYSAGGKETTGTFAIGCWAADLREIARNVEVGNVIAVRYDGYRGKRKTFIWAKS